MAEKGGNLAIFIHVLVAKLRHICMYYTIKLWSVLCGKAMKCNLEGELYHYCDVLMLLSMVGVRCIGWRRMSAIPSDTSLPLWFESFVQPLSC